MDDQSETFLFLALITIPLIIRGSISSALMCSSSEEEEFENFKTDGFGYIMKLTFP